MKTIKKSDQQVHFSLPSHYLNDWFQLHHGYRNFSGVVHALCKNKIIPTSSNNTKNVPCPICQQYLIVKEFYIKLPDSLQRNHNLTCHNCGHNFNILVPELEQPYIPCNFCNYPLDKTKAIQLLSDKTRYAHEICYTPERQKFDIEFRDLEIRGKALAKKSSIKLQKEKYIDGIIKTFSFISLGASIFLVIYSLTTNSTTYVILFISLWLFIFFLAGKAYNDDGLKYTLKYAFKLKPPEVRIDSLRSVSDIMRLPKEDYAILYCRHSYAHIDKNWYEYTIEYDAEIIKEIANDDSLSRLKKCANNLTVRTQAEFISQCSFLLEFNIFYVEYSILSKVREKRLWHSEKRDR